MILNRILPTPANGGIEMTTRAFGCGGQEAQTTDTTETTARPRRATLPPEPPPPPPSFGTNASCLLPLSSVTPAVSSLFTSSSYNVIIIVVA